MISLLVTFILNCSPAGCEKVNLSREALAIMACESGDTQTLGSYDWNAININEDGTRDGGAFQFNDYWVWNTSDRWVMRPVAKQLGITSDELFRRYPNAESASSFAQYTAFLYLWDSGRGWKHWSSSQLCWSKWMDVQEDRAVLK